MIDKGYFIQIITGLLLAISCARLANGHDAKDFDDTILYRIDFEVPDFDKNPVSRRKLSCF